MIGFNQKWIDKFVKVANELCPTKKFDLHLGNATFKIKLYDFSSYGAMYDVYECVNRKHWLSRSKKFLFHSMVSPGDNIKEVIIKSIENYLSDRAALNAAFDSFFKQVDEL